MKTVISAKLKLNTTPEQFNAMRATQLAYRDALNFVSKYAFDHGKRWMPTLRAKLARCVGIPVMKIARTMV